MTMKSAHVAAVAIVLIFVVAAFAYVIIVAPGHPAQQYQAAMQPGSTVSTGTSSSPPSQSCTVYTSQALQFGATFLNQSSNPVKPNAVVGQTVSIYTIGGLKPVQTGTTTVGSVSISGLNSCTNYLAFVGDNSKFFPNATIFNMGTSTNPTLNVVLQPYGAPTIQAQASSTSAFASETSVVTVAPGASTSNPGITVQASSSGYDGLGYGIGVYTYNSLAFNQPLLTGTVPTVGGLTPSQMLAGYAPSYVTSNTNDPEWASIGSQNAYVGYFLPAGTNGQYSSISGAAGNQGQGTLNAQISARGSYGTENEVIGFTWIPVTLFYNTQVNPSTGQAYGVQTLAINPFTNSPIITATTTSNAIRLN